MISRALPLQSRGSVFINHHFRPSAILRPPEGNEADRKAPTSRWRPERGPGRLSEGDGETTLSSGSACRCRPPPSRSRRYLDCGGAHLGCGPGARQDYRSRRAPHSASRLAPRPACCRAAEPRPCRRRGAAGPGRARSGSGEPAGRRERRPPPRSLLVLRRAGGPRWASSPSSASPPASTACPSRRTSGTGRGSES